MAHFAAAIFLGAFLLFQVQPVTARLVLPAFGGASVVWTTSLVFFQCALVIGYAYAHGLRHQFTPRKQWQVHSLVLAAAVLWVLFRPGVEPEGFDPTNPSVEILGFLVTQLGIPFVVLAATGPLVQAWFTLASQGRDPYRLFAVSNLGSLLALLTYPLLLEPFVTLGVQVGLWSAGFVLFSLLMSSLGWRIRHLSNPELGTPFEAGTAGPGEYPAITGGRRMLWLLLATLPSGLLMSTTQLMTAEVGAVPLLWIAPLALYLISFIVCFENSHWYRRAAFIRFFFLAALTSLLVRGGGIDTPLLVQLVVYAAVCFGAAMCGHGELYRLRPGPADLTQFYLMVALGGALGAVGTGLVAPVLFNNLVEYGLGITLMAGVLIALFFGDASSRRVLSDALRPGVRRVPLQVLVMAGVVAVVLAVVAPGAVMGYSLLALHIAVVIAALGGAVLVLRLGASGLAKRLRGGVRQTVGLALATFALAFLVADLVKEEDGHKRVAQLRNSYGVLTVVEQGGFRALYHGNTVHGLEPIAEAALPTPNSYYTASSGVGVAFRHLRNAHASSPAAVGLVGLGVGTVCGWLRPTDAIDVFEINKQVVWVAENYFSFWRQCPEATQLVMGDARLSLEAGLGDIASYDLLIGDAFSSDAVPTHLLTREAMAVYASRLAPNGVLALHVSSRFLRLHPMVRATAAAEGFSAIQFLDSPKTPGSSPSRWILLSRNHQVVEQLSEIKQPTAWDGALYPIIWTDDFHSIVQIIRWKFSGDWLARAYAWFRA